MDNFHNNQQQPFYNTLELSNEEWNDENIKAAGLQSIIRKVYEHNPGTKISPWQMKWYLEKKLQKRININSTRRSMSNLKNEDVLIILKDKRIGDEGQPEHFYILKKGNEHLKEPELKKGESVVDFSKKIQGIQKGLFD